MPDIQGTQYITVTKAAKRIGVARQTVHRWIKEERLDGVIDFGDKAKTRYLIPADVVDGFTPPTNVGNRRGRPIGSKSSDKD